MNKTTVQNKEQRGFTLIELLVVIGILAILLAITLIAINPARQFGQANDTKRRSAITQILNAVGAYTADNQGQLPGALTAATETEISKGGQDLCSALVPKYIPALPQDPNSNGGADISTACPAGYDTGYKIFKDGNNRVTVTAPLSYQQVTDGGAEITVTR